MALKDEELGIIRMYKIETSTLMDKINCIIVDDEKFARDLIEDLLKDQADFHVLGKFRNTIEAQRFLQADNHVDLIFLDIQMPGQNGVEFLRSYQVAPKIVFTTAFPDYALEGFELEVLDYILKPITEERFNKALLKIRTTLITEQKASAFELIQTEKEQFITLKSGAYQYKVYFDDLIRLEADGEYIRYFTIDNSYFVLGSLKKAIHDLPEHFVQVHRSHIISLKQVTGREKYDLILKDNARIPIGKTYRSATLKRLSF